VHRGVTRRGQGGRNSPGAESLWWWRNTAAGAESLRGAPKNTNNITSTALSSIAYNAFASEKPQVRIWGRV